MTRPHPSHSKQPRLPCRMQVHCPHCRSTTRRVWHTHSQSGPKFVTFYPHINLKIFRNCSTLPATNTPPGLPMTPTTRSTTQSKITQNCTSGSFMHTQKLEAKQTFLTYHAPLPAVTKRMQTNSNDQPRMIPRPRIQTKSAPSVNCDQADKTWDWRNESARKLPDASDKPTTKKTKAPNCFLPVFFPH